MVFTVYADAVCGEEIISLRKFKWSSLRLWLGRKREEER